MTLRLLPLLALFALAGCIGATQPLDAAKSTPVASPEPATVTWDGHILVSQAGILAHNRDTEPLVMPIQKEGFVFDVKAPPSAMQVLLRWPGPGTAVIMVSTPHKDGKGFEYFTKPSAEKTSCLRIPPAEIVPGGWQVMVHTQDSMEADFTFEVTTVGGESRILAGEPHSSAEAAQTEEREALPCPAA